MLRRHSSELYCKRQILFIFIKHPVKKYRWNILSYHQLKENIIQQFSKIQKQYLIKSKFSFQFIQSFHLIYNFILISAKYSNMIEEEKPQNSEDVWDVYVKDQIDLLANYYIKRNVINYEEKINQAKRLFGNLKGSILKSKMNGNGEYFKKFAYLQKQKYIQKIVYAGGKHFFTNRHNRHQQNLYNNHKSLIKYLTMERYSLQNIAAHIFRDESSQHSFTFLIQKGICYGSNSGNWQINSTLLFYIFLRDLANSILELQSHGIFHADIAMRNIILYNCRQDQVKNNEILKIRENKIKFKLIDFSNAFFIEGQNRSLTQRIFEEKKQIENQSILGLFSHESSFINPNLKYKNILLDRQAYKRIHSEQFLSILLDINQRLYFQVKTQSYESMIKKRQYKQLICEMNHRIKQEIGRGK